MKYQGKKENLIKKKKRKKERKKEYPYCLKVINQHCNLSLKEENTEVP